MKSTTPTNYVEVRVTCHCGNSFTTRSALGKPLRIDVCSQCHPFYTGKHKTVSNEHGVRQFQKKYGVK